MHEPYFKYEWHKCRKNDDFADADFWFEIPTTTFSSFVALHICGLTTMHHNDANAITELRFVRRLYFPGDHVSGNRASLTSDNSTQASG